MYYSISFSNRPFSYKKISMMAKIAVINSRRRTGDVTKVAGRTGFSTSYVSDVLNGHYTNERIINAAYDMTRGRVQNHSYIA
jgi:hypothetical protein